MYIVIEIKRCVKHVLTHNYLSCFAVKHELTHIYFSCFAVKHELTHNYFSFFAVKLFISVVLLFGSQQMVRDMMLQAYDAGQ